MMTFLYLDTLPFLNTACTCGISQFKYIWSLIWRILNIILLAWEMSAIVYTLNILWHCLSLGRQFSSVTQLCLTLCDPKNHSTPGLPIHHQLPEFTQTHVHWVSDAIQPSHPLSFPSPAFNLSQHQGLYKCQFFASCGQSTGVSASALVFPTNIQDWFPLGLTGWIALIQETLKSLLQHHSSKAPVLQCSAFFIVQLSHPYMTTGKTIALTRPLTRLRLLLAK